MHYYHAFGLRIASEIELPELHPGSGPADIHIHFRSTPQQNIVDPERWFSVNDDSVWLKMGGIAFLVEGGRTIRVEALPETPVADVRVWLLGTVMAALLHQRGYLPIHANVIANGEASAAAFAGDSGAGKSTLAAWFEGRDYRVLADDLCVIRIGSDDKPQLFEGIPRLKLWAEALEALGRGTKGLEQVFSETDKYHVPMRRSRELGSLEPLDLERIYLLDRAAEGDALAIERLTGAEAARGILANAYRWEMGQEIQEPRAQFDQCLALARHCAVFRIARRWGMEWFGEDAEAIERHMKTPLAGLPKAKRT